MKKVHALSLVVFVLILFILLSISFIFAVDVSIDDDAVEGDPNAPVTIIEFSDYECPFCERFYSQTLDQIRNQYIETGKVKIVFRDFPLSFHQQAQKAAEAAECAGEQGKYYEMHDKLFESGVSGGVDSFKKYAEELEMNKDDFNSCLDSGEMASEVQKDFQDGQKFGVRGTPAFFINGKMISGAQSFAIFQQAIDEELGIEEEDNEEIESIFLEDPIIGDINAEVTIIEYGDFECPFCKIFYDGAYGDIKSNYIRTGKVKLVFKHFPLSFHQNAQKAAEAAECAHSQGKFEEMYDELFKEGVNGGVDSFKNYAKEIGLNAREFEDCLDLGKTAESIKDDFENGQSEGIRGTPGFFINGKLISGAQSFAIFQQAIDEELGIEEEDDDEETVDESEKSSKGGKSGTGKVIDEPDKETVCLSCKEGEKCYPAGYRKEGKFCSVEEDRFIKQLKEASSCENSFECKSNLCVSGECVSGGLLQKIINWLKKLFT